MFQRIISLQPPHEVYVEPFLGSGAVMFRKRPAALNVGIDLDSRVIARAAGVAGGGVGPVFDFRCEDGISYLQGRRWGPTDLVYCDPPYLKETRSCQRRLYRYELESSDHERLLVVLQGLPCLVQVSGYFSRMYSFALRGWNYVAYDVLVRSGALRRECLWYNYPHPVELHDYQYAGGGYRERERMKRKRQRWVRMLLAMPLCERKLLLEALQAENRQEGRH